MDNLVAIMKNLGIPMANDGYILDYMIDGEWKHLSGIVAYNGFCEEIEDEEFVDGLINANKDKGITKENVSHVGRICDYEGDRETLRKASNDHVEMDKLIRTHAGKCKLIVVNPQLFALYATD